MCKTVMISVEAEQEEYRGGVLFPGLVRARVVRPEQIPGNRFRTFCTTGGSCKEAIELMQRRLAAFNCYGVVVRRNRREH